MSPILEPKPNVRLHRGTPDALLDKVVEMIASSQGAPFLLNFDERSMAGMMLEAEKAGVEHLIHPGNVYDYAPVGCLENTMVRQRPLRHRGQQPEPAQSRGAGPHRRVRLDPLHRPAHRQDRKAATLGTGHRRPGANARPGSSSGRRTRPRHATSSSKSVEVYEKSEAIRAQFFPTPYLSCLVQGCAEKGLDVNQGGAELSFVTIEGVTYATTVDSLLAVKYLVFDQQACTLPELVEALQEQLGGLRGAAGQGSAQGAQVRAGR